LQMLDDIDRIAGLGRAGRTTLPKIKELLVHPNLEVRARARQLMVEAVRAS
jgi:hypothetical protein